MSDLTNQVLLRRYRVEAFIGRGGMADVYRVWDEQRAVNLAIKVLHLTKDDALRSFLLEAQVLKDLNHPHIVRLYEFEHDEEQGLRFLVMDYIDGSTLKELIIRKRPRPFAPRRKQARASSS